MSLSEFISQVQNGKKSGKGFRVRTANHFRQIIRKIKYRLCHLLCKDLVFNSDMSLEIDRLTQENEQLKEQISGR